MSSAHVPARTRADDLGLRRYVVQCLSFWMPEREKHVHDRDQAEEGVDTGQHPNSRPDENRAPRQRTGGVAVINGYDAQPTKQLPRCCRFPAQKANVVEHSDADRGHGQDQLVATGDQLRHAHRWRCYTKPLSFEHGVEIACPRRVQRLPHREGDARDDRAEDHVVDHDGQCTPPPRCERNAVGGRGRLHRHRTRSGAAQRGPHIGTAAIGCRVGRIRCLAVTSARCGLFEGPRIAGPLPAVPIPLLCRVHRVDVPATRRGMTSWRSRRRAYGDVRHTFIVVSRLGCISESQHRWATANSQ